MSWSNRPDIKSGRAARGHEWEALLDQVDSLTAPSWESYTPVWTASVSNPVIGNGSIVGRKRRPVDSDWVVNTVTITMGSTTTYGSGFFIVSLSDTATASDPLLGAGRLLDSGTIERPFTVRKNSTSSVVIITDGGAATATNPITWATNDVIEFTIQFEAG